MASLTNTDKNLIKENGGVLLNNGKMVRFDKSDKPSRECKKRLVELGYKHSNESGKSYYRFVDYVLP